ncbi:oligosaccharide flippase family protein [Homoserinimonas aerilata]|uniref:oligosaccharide flippase family protein n=1 Tax=Homoserinimonas aerilata TaxID=1162970 RepID=UPI0011518D6F|nr:oligosaccharide flippase family protein [Homoserinimonas aerilata]
MWPPWSRRSWRWDDARGGLGCGALVGQILVSAVPDRRARLGGARWRPAFAFSYAEFRVMARFGSQVLGVEFVAMFRAWAEAAIISTVLGMAALGYLNIAQRLVQIVQDLTGAALVPVSTVAFAKIRAPPSAAQRLPQSAPG